MPSTGPDAASASTNTVLTAMLSKTVRQFAKKHAIDRNGSALAREGAALLGRIILGSELVGSSSHHRHTSSLAPRSAPEFATDGIREYAAALHVLARRETVLKEVTMLLVDYRNNLLAIADSRPVAKKDLQELADFLRQLNATFFRELHEQVSAASQDPLGSVDNW